jgi:hypothetical protein
VLRKKKEQVEFMKRDGGLQRLIDACQPWYEIQQEGRESEMRSVKILFIPDGSSDRFVKGKGS